MGQGAQSKALRIANMTQYGFDATKIYDANGNVVGDIGNFDKAPVLFSNQAGTGNLPQGTPSAFPEDHPEVSKMFDTPDVGRENADRRTSNADPFPGGGWQEGD